MIKRSTLSLLGITAILGTTMMVTGQTTQDARPKIQDQPAVKEMDKDKDKDKDKAVKAKVGEAAPNFSLKDTDGKAHQLSDYEGKIVVLQWINPQCPVCRRVCSDGTVATMSRQLKGMDVEVVHLTINSTHFMGPKDTAAYLKQHKLEAPGLDDSDGTVGRMYGARTTPHLYVIDTEGVLRYSGAIDNNANRDQDAPVNYATNAVQQIAAGATVSPDQTKPYGCSVKYKKGDGDGKGKRRY